MMMMCEWFGTNELGKDHDDFGEENVVTSPQHSIDDVFDYYFNGSGSSSTTIDEKRLLSVPTDTDDAHYQHFGGLEVIEEETDFELLFEEMVNDIEENGMPQ